jgi:hypothetical protein
MSALGIQTMIVDRHKPDFLTRLVNLLLLALALVVLVGTLDQGRVGFAQIKALLSREENLLQPRKPFRTEAALHHARHLTPSKRIG